MGVAYDKAYGATLNYLKREGYTIDSASPDTGQIITGMEVKGGYSPAAPEPASKLRA